MMSDSTLSSIAVGILAKHPVMGTILTLGLALAGRIVPSLDMQIPIIVMQGIQILVWSIGATVGILTIRGLGKKTK